jgi:predicted amidohydrolase
MSFKDQLLAQAVSAMLTYKSRPRAIRGVLASHKYTRAAAPTPERVMVAVIQMELDLIDDGSAFAERYYALVRQAVERGAQLIVFPEYAWLPILGLIPKVRELALEGVTLTNAIEELAPGRGLTIGGTFRMIAPAVKRIFEATARELAARFGVYLMPGSAITMDSDGRLFNTAYLFGPDGALIGTQNKLHSTALEKDWMTSGDALHVFELPFAKIALPVCMDFTYWETTRVATLRGAEILLDFSADATANQKYLAARGDESRIQECLAYSTRAYCVTKLFGLDFCGPSHIAAPLGLLSNDATYLTRARSHDREEIIVAELDLAHLRQFRAKQPRDFNIALYEKYLPRVYEAYHLRVTQDGGRRIV